MTPLYKSTGLHRQQRAQEWEGGESGRGISSPGFSGKSLCSKMDPDLIIDRQQCRAPRPGPRQTSPTATQTTADKRRM